MNDKNKIDTNVASKGPNNSKNNGMISTNYRFFEDCSNDDDILNNKVQASISPEDKMNEEKVIENSIESTNKMSKYSDDENYENSKEDEHFISSLPNPPSTGLMP